MNTEITYGTKIHSDKTIAKYEHWTFETEEEFWNHYDLTFNDPKFTGDTSASLESLSFRKRTYITVEEYREAIKGV